MGSLAGRNTCIFSGDSAQHSMHSNEEKSAGAILLVEHGF